MIRPERRGPNGGVRPRRRFHPAIALRRRAGIPGVLPLKNQVFRRDDLTCPPAGIAGCPVERIIQGADARLAPGLCPEFSGQALFGPDGQTNIFDQSIKIHESILGKLILSLKYQAPGNQKQAASPHMVKSSEIPPSRPGLGGISSLLSCVSRLHDLVRSREISSPCAARHRGPSRKGAPNRR